MKPELLVPYGKAPDGILVKPAQAKREIVYICPACADPLVLHAGEHNVRHFAHKANTACSGETIAHKTAKALLVQIIAEQTTASNPRPITLFSPCSCCGAKFRQTLPASAISCGREEVAIGDFVCDVVAFRGAGAVLALEVWMTHAVDERKAMALPLPWAELRAEHVLEDPYVWRPIAGKMNAVTCPDCKTHIKKLKALAEKWDLPVIEPARYRDLSRGPYLSAIETCWSCKSEIPVYWWPGVPFCQTEPANPKPRTVQFRHSKNFGGSYWANTCPCCKAVQGDNFLFLGAKPRFAGLPLRDTPEMKAHRAHAVDRVVRHMFRNF